MSAMKKPINKVFMTSEEGCQKMLKSFDPVLMERILKNSERVKKQFVDRKPS